MPGATPYVLVEERNGSKMSKGRKIFALVLCISALVLSGLLFVHGIMSLIATHSHYFYYGPIYSFQRGIDFERNTANFSIRVISAYMLLFAFLFICVELRSTTILTAFAGMISPLGRGVVYLITGLIVFGTVGNWGIIYGLLWMICGIGHIVFGLRNCRNFYDEGTVDSSSAVASSGSSSSYESSSSEKNFCRSCGASLRPDDQFCPDCSAKV